MRHIRIVGQVTTAPNGRRVLELWGWYIIPFEGGPVAGWGFIRQVDL